MRSGSDERGSATVEFALVLPAVVMVLALLMGAARWGAASVLAADAASTAARVAMVEGEAVGVTAGEAVAPGRVEVVLTLTDGWWRAEATVSGHGPLPDATAVALSWQP